MCPHGPIDEVSLAQHLEERPHRKLLHGHHEHDGPPHEPHGPHPHPPLPTPWEDLTPGKRNCFTYKGDLPFLSAWCRPVNCSGLLLLLSTSNKALASKSCTYGLQDVHGTSGCKECWGASSGHVTVSYYCQAQQCKGFQLPCHPHMSVRTVLLVLCLWCACNEQLWAISNCAAHDFLSTAHLALAKLCFTAVQSARWPSWARA